MSYKINENNDNVSTTPYSVPPHAIGIDSTLTKARYAADAQATGAAIKDAAKVVADNKSLSPNMSNLLEVFGFENAESNTTPIKVNGEITWGQAGVTDYNDLDNKPQINSVELVGNKSLSELGVASQSDLSSITNRVTAAESSITTNTNNIASINTKIPTDASEENKLADKNFVNSSVATNTAHYISNNGQPFNSLQELQSYTGIVTTNDYAFITGIDEQGNTYFDRYKATVTGTTVSWAKEYRLNNSSFTAVQWEAINSGINENRILTYDNYSSTKQDKLIAGDNIQIDSSNKISANLNSDVTISNSLTVGTRASSSSIGQYSTSEGINNIASEKYSHAEGNGSQATGMYSHAENKSVAEGTSSHSEGYNSTAIGSTSHAEGANTTAYGDYSHSEGVSCHAEGNASHAQGRSTIAYHNNSTSMGLGTHTTKSEQLVTGKYNETNDTDALFIIGNGTSDSDRKNLFKVNSSGAYFNDSKLTTQSDVSNKADLVNGKVPNNELPTSLTFETLTTPTVVIEPANINYQIKQIASESADKLFIGDNQGDEGANIQFSTAGDGSASIDITASPLNYNGSEVAVKSDIDDKQDKLTAGTNITIDANNVISTTSSGPEQYIKKVQTDEEGRTLIFTKQDDSRFNYYSSNVSGENDGTNWTSLSIDGIEYDIPSGGLPTATEAGTALIYNGSEWQQQTGYGYKNNDAIVRTWNGDITGKTVLEDEYFYLIDSTTKFTLSEFQQGGTIQFQCDGMPFQITYTSSDVEQDPSSGAIIIRSSLVDPVLIKYIPGEGENPGSLYFVGYCDEGKTQCAWYVSKFVIGTEVVQQISNDLLPLASVEINEEAGVTNIQPGAVSVLSVPIFSEAHQSLTGIYAVKELGNFLVLDTSSESQISSRDENISVLTPSTLNYAVTAALTDDNKIALTDGEKTTACTTLGAAQASAIPTKTSQLTNDSGFLTEHQSLSAYRTSSAQDVIDETKQTLLVSGVSIKTINNESLLGPGNINSSVSIRTKTINIGESSATISFNGIYLSSYVTNASGNEMSVTKTIKNNKIVFELASATGEALICNVVIYNDIPEELCFTANTANSTIELLKVGSPSIENTSYSTDGVTWTTFTPSTTAGTNKITLVNAGDKVYFRNDITGNFDTDNHLQFKMSGSTSASGNINSLYSATNFSDLTTLTYTHCYYGLFSECSSLITSPQLPATTLSYSCYSNMFYECGSLISTPSLPATTLASSCYAGMFWECTSLTAAPALPATTLVDSCYDYMFFRCTSLAIAPSLPATTLANYCYDGMFNGCTSLTTAPSLPATTLASSCYVEMFKGCTSLITAPSLPATTLTSNCYKNMFYGCTSLITAPSLPATILAGDCYYGMFCNCTSLTTAPSLPATALSSYCYANMFNGCTSLTTAPSLPATTLASSCYAGMFCNCTSLTIAPKLPATILAGDCYYGMFRNCTALTTVPQLPATKLESECYANMFNGCTSLYVSKEQGTGFANEWHIPTADTFTNTSRYDQTGVFTNCLGTRSSNNINGVKGTNYTYYTQNEPV